MERSWPFHPSSPAGKELKYARPELERRFLLAGLPAGESTKVATISDRYLRGTRLRLRQTLETDSSGARMYYKLTQKVPAPDGSPGLITTVYLSEAEHAVLSAVPALELRKTRHSLGPLGVDVFDGPLAGLFLAEAEFETEEALTRFPVPSCALAEVTADVRFTGGRFAAMSAKQLGELLAPFGLRAG